MDRAVRRLHLISPAKINLSLAILGKRPDGFHALHSVVAQTEFGDQLDLEWNPDSTDRDRVCFKNLELDEFNNSLWAALHAYRSASGMSDGQFILHLDKQIPVGAGLGGGSSNAVTVLKGIRDLIPEQSENLDWSAMAAEIGSDCPLFLEEKPVVMEGRGEQIHRLDEALAERLVGKTVILFKPAFSINTAEAYARLARCKYYQTMDKAQKLMDEWGNGTNLLPRRCNDFERLVEDWIPGLAVVLDRLRTIHGLDARMSGSGSACFIFPNDPVFAIRILQEELASAWGSSYWIQETCVK